VIARALAFGEKDGEGDNLPRLLARDACVSITG